MKTTMTFKRIRDFFKTYFLRGLFYIAPLILTVYILYSFLLWIYHLLPVKNIWYLLLSLIFLLTGITIIGFLGSGLLRSLFLTFEKILEGTPLVKVIYTSLKDLLDAFSGAKKKFDHPVLVKVNEQPLIYRMGFITKSTAELIGIEKKLVVVYFPFSYALTGEMILTPAENIEPIENIKSADAMKFILSGGITNIDISDKNE